MGANASENGDHGAPPLTLASTTTVSLIRAATAGAISAFDASGFPVSFACEAKEFDPTRWIEYRQARRMDRRAQLVVAAARQAEFDSGIVIEKESDRVGASVASAMGGLKSLEDCCDTLIEREPDRLNPFSLLAIIPNMSAAWVSINWHARAALVAVHRLRRLADGDRRRPRCDPARRADVMLCGGTDAAITRADRRLLGDARFPAATMNPGGKSAVRRRPRRVRDGRGGRDPGARGAEHAKREAKVYAELLGYGVSSDAGHITEPDPTGQHQARAMKMAFADAGINPEEIDYINAHGTSTPLGDASETRVIKRARRGQRPEDAGFLDEGATGHRLGAAGGVEAIFCTLAIHEGVLPPTINYDTPDPEATSTTSRSPRGRHPDRRFQLVRLCGNNARLPCCAASRDR